MRSHRRRRCPVRHSCSVFLPKTPSQCNQDKHTSIILDQQLLARPVLVVAVGEVSPYYKRDLLLAQLLGRNLKRICHALDIDQNGSVSTAKLSALYNICAVPQSLPT